MYRNKRDIDKHVENLRSKLSEKEFFSRAYSIARLYFDIGDYINCQKYVEQYVNHKDNNAAAHKLLGQTLQKLGHKEKALDQFKISLEIDPTQTSLILDICELLADDEVFMNSGRATYWCTKAEAIFPKHPVTFRLREKLLTTTDPEPEAVVSLLKSELAARPKDPMLHSRLLRHYLKNNRMNDAFNHSFNVEFNDNMFQNNLSWYETVNEILKNDTFNAKDWKYQLLLLTVKEKLVLLSLNETPSGNSRSLVESNELLHHYDQAIHSVATTGAPFGSNEFYNGLLEHHKGQLSFHVATFALKCAKRNRLSWRVGTTVAAPFMLIAWHSVLLDIKVNWLQHAPEVQKNAIHRWYVEASYRCSQSGHYLFSNAQDRSQSFLDEVTQTCSSQDWKYKLYEKVFKNGDYLNKTKSSYIMSDAFSQPSYRLPRKAEIESYDADAQQYYPNSLHHFVWILLNYKNYAAFKCEIFDNLSPKSSNYNNCGPETLNKLDILAFLYSSAFTAEQKNVNSYGSLDKPKIIPANVTDMLCTPSQMKWWDCAYKFSQNILGSELTDIRMTLSRGLEVIRCIDNHGLDPELLCKVARVFKDMAKSANNPDMRTNIESRASLYYTSALSFLEKIKNKVVALVPDKRLFDYTHKELPNKYLNGLIEECRIYAAEILIKDADYEKAIEMLINIKTPQSFYHLAQTYKKMSMEDLNAKDISDSDFKTKPGVFIAQAKNYAYKALEQLKATLDGTNSNLYVETQQLIEDIETNFSKFDQDITNDHDGKYSSDENVSMPGNDRFSLHSHFRNISSTPKQPTNTTNYRTAVDSQVFDQSKTDIKSLERIEKQIYNLQKRDSAVDALLEETKAWFEENRDLGKIIGSINANLKNTTDQFKQLKISVDQVKDQITECRNECKDVGELKKQIDELKKEVNKLKKTSEHTDDNEHLNADDESSHLSSHPALNPAQAMPTMNQRLLQQFPIAQNPYHQLYGQNLYNLYSQYSQFGQVPTVPGAAALFESARSQVNYPGVFPNAEQMYPDVSHYLPNTVPPVPTIPAVPISVPPPAAVVLPKPINTAPPKESARSLPVNVVITSSDPLPSLNTGPQPVLSVTIPSKHIKQTPHNYQITVPKQNENKLTPTMFNTNKADISTPILSSNVKPTIEATFSILNTPKNTPDNSITVVDGNRSTFESPNTSLNKSRTLSERSNTSVDNYDPCPDFKPIIPLPDEIKVTTGEEDELTIFSARAKLYRFVDKQWKERGLGEMKLLKHKATGKVRVLMRREQIHKICANHIITPDMEIQPMNNETKAYFWVANDFADEKVVLEKFSARFKTSEIAKQFYEAFEKARKEVTTPQKKQESDKEPKQADIKKEAAAINPNIPPKEESKADKTTIGGFTFSGKPNFKAVDVESATKPTETDNKKPNPFSALSFKSNTTSPFTNLLKLTSTEPTNVSSPSREDPAEKHNNSDTVEEFEPTVDFKPVVPLPALVEQKTGEENETVFFEHRAKLLRFIAENKEWKERGIGNIKILVNKDNEQKVRLLMRREQVMKVCCNHSITKDMVFEKMPNMPKAVTWCAQDFSEGELIPETFCLRFKNVNACDDFIQAVKVAQEKLKEKVTEAPATAAVTSTTAGFGDSFKPKAGSWMCDACYTNNLENFLKCACCEQPKPGQPEKAAPKSQTSGWGDKFKPKSGTWECQQCFIRNESDKPTCVACNSPKDPTAKQENQTVINNAPKFNFGIPAQSGLTNTPVANVTKTTPATSSPATGWGEKFKPKEGSWECQMCLVRNESTSLNCCSCNSPKDPSAAKTETKSIFGTNAPKFSFGIPAGTNNTDTTAVSNSIFDGTGAHKFTFGIPTLGFGSTTPETANTPKTTGVIFAAPKKPEEPNKPVDFSILTNADVSVTVKGGLLPTPQNESTTFGNKESGSFDFVFKPKSPPKSKSPGKSPKADKGEESDDNEYASEDEGHHIHFNPIIPLPDKVEVVTGEEHEEELYGHRAKLFRFINGEWKERGIGVVKILKHKLTGKLRVVMRREQVFKICLNHALTPEITYSAKDDKTWLFAAYDYSEGEFSTEKFCLRFKSKEIATEFKNAIDKARGAESSTSTDKTEDEDVVFISETHATSEDKQKAKDLMLPEHFFTYKNKDACPGCRGCENDDSPVPSTPAKTSTPVFYSPAVSVYSTPANFNKTFDNSVFRTPFESAGSNAKSLSENNSSDSLQTPVKDVKKENVFEVKSNLFGNFTQKESFFGKPQNNTAPQPNATKTAILAAPKLNNLNVSGESTPQETDAKSVFQLASKTTFGDAATAFNNQPAGNKSLFGNSASTNKSIFGSTNNSTESADKPAVRSIFGSGMESKPESIFGSGTAGSLFGPTTTKETSTSIFGNSTFGTGTSIFGSAFGAKAEQNKTDETKPNQPIFGSKISEIKNEVVKTECPFKTDNTLSFAALSSNEGAFSKKTDNFQWEGVGQQLFGIGKTQKDKKVDTSTNNGGAEEEETTGAGDEEYDPHYEPIVPLPDKIVVTTGEEDEEKVFSERAKLYRYDEQSRQWKERGVGEMKVLYHPERKTYRLLLRREQVHKLVLNMLLFMDFEVLPMSNSDRAWTWIGRNFAENPQGEQETLAVRFKSVDLATNFHDKIVESVRNLQALAAQKIREEKETTNTVTTMRLPKHLEETARADHTLSAIAERLTAEAVKSKQNGDTVAKVEKTVQFQDDEEHADDEDEYQEDEEDYEAYYSEEIFECSGSAVVVNGNQQNACESAYVQVHFDQELYCPKILVTDPATGELLADMLISTDTEFKLSDTTCTWSGTNSISNDSEESTVTIKFPDVDTAMQFYDSCETNKALTYTSEDPES